MILGAVVWHWWLAPLLTAGGVLLILSLIFGYYKKVIAIRYPPKAKIPSAPAISAPTEEAPEEKALEGSTE